MIKIRMFAPLLGLLALAACSDELQVPDFNNEGLGSLIENPTRANLGSASVGLLITGRDEFDDTNGFVSLLGILGRESYNFDSSDPRFITEMLQSQLNSSSPAFGGNLWGERYSNVRTGSIILAGTENLAEGEMTAEEIAGMQGYVKTLVAYELLLTLNSHSVSGIVVDIPLEVSADPGPFVPESQALDAIAAMLDDGADDLSNAGGADFTFSLTSGFDGFDTPATFREFNRALAARVDLYRGDDAGALSALAESFIDATAAFSWPGTADLGVYHSYSTSAGDKSNLLFDADPDAPDLVAHPDLKNFQTQPGGAPDQRYQDKIRDVDSQSSLGHTTDIAFLIYDGFDAPVPYIRNEELILIRAEANANSSNFIAATADINIIRVLSGGLAPVALLTASTFEDELLYNRQYSLMWEGGHRWIDALRLDRLDILPLDTGTDVRNTGFPVPEAECLARGTTPTLGSNESNPSSGGCA